MALVSKKGYCCGVELQGKRTQEINQLIDQLLIEIIILVADERLDERMCQYVVCRECKQGRTYAGALHYADSKARYWLSI